MIGDDLDTLLLRSLIGQLDVRWATSPVGGRSLVVIAPAVRPTAVLDTCTPLVDTGRAPYVPLAGAERPHGA